MAGVVLVVYLLTAWFSTGYHHPDEHFQLIEFAGLKSGWNSVTDLPWEYEAQIRPAFQPTVAYGVIMVLQRTGISSPYDAALALRLLSALLALGSICCFVKNFIGTVDAGHRTAYIWLSFLLWFLPAVNVRFSSETWAGAFFLLALSRVYGDEHPSANSCRWMGVMLGLSFECRYQIALAAVGLLGWIAWTGKWSGRQWRNFVGGGLLTVAGGMVIDSWFYGTFVLAPFNYFRVNIWQDAASSFGVSPWSFYLLQILERPTWLIGAGLLFSAVGALFYRWRNPVIWCLAPFIVIHSLIPHKELRFLFPVANFAPLLLVWGYEQLTTLVDKRVCRGWFVLCCLLNAGGLLMMSGKPADYGNVRMMHYLTLHYADTTADMPVYVTPQANPFLESSYLPVRFYEDNRISLYDYVANTTHPSLSPTANTKHSAVVVMAMEKDRIADLTAHGFTEKYRSMPALTELLNRFYQVHNERKTLILYSK